MRFCKCGAVAVDGGMDYLRRVGEPSNIEEMSLSVSQGHLDLLKDAISDPERNELGRVCNLARVLRDNMGIMLQEKGNE